MMCIIIICPRLT